MIWNDLKKEYQFPKICETTEKGANTLLFKLIGNDAYKYRFKVVRVEKEKAKILRHLPQGRCRGLYQGNHAIVARFCESFSDVFRNKNS